MLATTHDLVDFIVNLAWTSDADGRTLLEDLADEPDEALNELAYEKRPEEVLRARLRETELDPRYQGILVAKALNAANEIMEKRTLAAAEHAAMASNPLYGMF